MGGAAGLPLALAELPAAELRLGPLNHWAKAISRDNAAAKKVAVTIHDFFIVASSESRI